MSLEKFAIAQETRLGAVGFAEPDNCLWLGTVTGDIETFSLHDQSTSVLGHGYADIVAVQPLPDGLGLIVVEAAGSVLVVARQAADRVHAVMVTDLGRPVKCAQLIPGTDHVLVVDDESSAAAVTIDVSTGTVKTLATGLDSPRAVAIDEPRRRAVILAQPPGDVCWLYLVDIDTGAVATESAWCDQASALATAPPSMDGVLVASEMDGTVGLVRFDGAPSEVGEGSGEVVCGLARWGSLVLMVTPSSVAAYEWGLDPGPMYLSVPLGPVFVGGYFRALADLGAEGLNLTDVVVSIEEGPAAGFVSAGIEMPDPSGLQPVLIGAGPEHGEFHLTVARAGAPQQRLARRRFRVTSHWPDEKHGPGVAVTGTRQVFAHAWGGGPTGPQNIKVHPAPDTWRVAVVLISTDDVHYPAPSDTAATWQDLLIGSGESARTYYEEVSYWNTPPAAGGDPRGTTVSLARNEVFGPVDLPGGWGTYFEGGEPDRPWGGWNPKETTWQDLVTAFCSELHNQGRGEKVLRATDAVVFVVRTASDDVVSIGDQMMRAEFVWPEARMGDDMPTFWWKTPFSTSFISKPIVVMPDELPAHIPDEKRFELAQVLSHELGHTLGCNDLYNQGEYPPEVSAREINDLDLMGSEGLQWPHFSLANRMRLGWIAPSWIQKFDFGANPTGGHVILQAAETLSRSGPPAGRHAGIEIRIRDGRNYYCEYRRKQFGQVGDQGLLPVYGTNRLILGTDVDPTPNGLPARPDILLLPPDADGDGPFLKTNGQDYEESDVTDPQRMHDFRLVFDHIDADTNAAHVNVEYISARRPELQIRHAPGRGDWKSPDINVEGPGGVNRIAKGLTHTIAVTVRNAGNLAAENVRVHLSWLPFTTGPGDWRTLDLDPLPQNIPAGAQVEFRAQWQVPASLQVDGMEVEHFCVKADIAAYVDPLDPSHSEIVVYNNSAQSNFNSTAVSTGSPSTRCRTGITVTNTLAHPATFTHAAEQTSPYFRTYVGNAWLHLKPNETRMVEVLYESLAGDPVHGAEFDQAFAAEEGLAPNQVGLTSFVVPPELHRCRTSHPWWGAGLSIRAGFATRIGDLGCKGELVQGSVVGTHDETVMPLHDGSVNLVLWLADSPDEQTALGAEVTDGGFTVVVPGDILSAVQNGRELYGEALYSGTRRWAPSRSGARRLA
ncbi:hypothetical protein ACFV0T_29465 [Streptomyces sp. NPDC059582]|uniref:YncE family protein n=1 Tax=Streptomyces sp. NPDC059582 TaxID=3346875 RepID=UPI0036A3A415